jgi:hypothetical protein
MSVLDAVFIQMRGTHGEEKSSGCGCFGVIVGILIILFVGYAAYKIVDVRREGNAYLHDRR